MDDMVTVSAALAALGRDGAGYARSSLRVQRHLGLLPTNCKARGERTLWYNVVLRTRMNLVQVFVVYNVNFKH